MPESVDDFLAHYGVRGMKWGVRKAASALQEKSIEDRLDRRDKEKKLKRLIDEDLNPKRTAAKDFATNLMTQHKDVLVSGLTATASVAVGTAFMAYRLNRSFSGVSMSPIPFR